MVGNEEINLEKAIVSYLIKTMEGVPKERTQDTAVSFSRLYLFSGNETKSTIFSLRGRIIFSHIPNLIRSYTGSPVKVCGFIRCLNLHLQ